MHGLSRSTSRSHDSHSNVWPINKHLKVKWCHMTYVTNVWLSQIPYRKPCYYDNNIQDDGSERHWVAEVRTCQLYEPVLGVKVGHSKHTAIQYKQRTYILSWWHANSDYGTWYMWLTTFCFWTRSWIWCRRSRRQYPHWLLRSWRRAMQYERGWVCPVVYPLW